MRVRVCACSRARARSSISQQHQSSAVAVAVAPTVAVGVVAHFFGGWSSHYRLTVETIFVLSIALVENTTRLDSPAVPPFGRRNVPVVE